MSIGTHTVGKFRFGLLERGRGLPILLIHGFPLDHTMWNAQIEVLAAGYHVLAPDLRGFGASPPRGDKVTMQQFADDLVALLDARGVDGPVVVCGSSMGGYIAWQLWRKYSDRIRAMVLCDTRAAADGADGAAGRLETARRVEREGPGLLVDAMIPKLLAPQTVAARPKLVETLRGVIERTDRRAIAAALRGMAERGDVSAMLPSISCPALVMVGQHDAISTPQEMATIAEAIPAARLVEIAGSGHMSPMENPEHFNAALSEFLAALG